MIVGFWGGHLHASPPSPPSLWDLNGEDKENPDSPSHNPAPCHPPPILRLPPSLWGVGVGSGGQERTGVPRRQRSLPRKPQFTPTPPQEIPKKSVKNI